MKVNVKHHLCPHLSVKVDGKTIELCEEADDKAGYAIEIDPKKISRGDLRRIRHVGKVQILFKGQVIKRRSGIPSRA